MQLLELDDSLDEPRLGKMSTAGSTGIDPRPAPAAREIVLTTAMIADVLLVATALAVVLGSALLGYLTMTWHVGDFDAGAPLFIVIGDKLLLLGGALVGAAVGGLVAFLLSRAVRVAMGRQAPGDR
ncbi:hypothetical protein SAMN05892883_1689 [Jatrophihabitans sp. GAS493]|uniref:hypothetical protein n=1 Tax=Jatrophihabitans sp. GAS493 TaxID=1907575 RepID=UPI000BC07694|nr:hypothetical protein [Jatrophihabitans sp. GAS493]SOD72282.1 hypothetical protein SAMN05892883_1689 [Jatrophihabitans sp. GAS493]